MSEAFEAKKHAYRQTQDGIVVSFVIHPNDMPEHLALAPLGTRFGVAVAEIGDDEQPITAQGTPRVDGQSDRASAPDAAEAVGSSPIPVATKDRRKFSDLPLSQQCALRCRDERFWNFLSQNHGVIPNTDWPTVAASYIRTFCAVASRGEIGVDPNATAKWLNLEAEYQSYLTDEMFAEARR